MADRGPDEALVGLIALGSLVWIVSILRRGMKDGRLPLGKAEVRLTERRGPFHVLFAIYVLAAFAMTFIGLDLLFGLTNGRGRL
ncbi:MAG: hypothetical protein ACXW2T_05440 [Allosphingosinicella sp.]